MKCSRSCCCWWWWCLMMIMLTMIAVIIIDFSGDLGIRSEWWSAFAILLFVQLVALPCQRVFWRNIRLRTNLFHSRKLLLLGHRLSQIWFQFLKKTIFALNHHSCGFSYVLTIEFLWIDVIECSCYLWRWHWWPPSTSSSSSSLRKGGAPVGLMCVVDDDDDNDADDDDDDDDDVWWWWSS